MLDINAVEPASHRAVIDYLAHLKVQSSRELGLALLGLMSYSALLIAREGGPQSLMSLLAMLATEYAETNVVVLTVPVETSPDGQQVH